MELIVTTASGTPVVRVSSEEEATRWAVFIGGQVEKT